MERKDYAEKFREIKDEILDEIRAIVPNDSVHYYSDEFYVHYIDGEVATSDICSAVEVDKSDMVIFHVHSEGDNETEMIEGETVYGYDSESFIDILANLKKDVREKKLGIIRNLLNNNGGSIAVKDNFEFLCADEGDKNNLSHSCLKGIKIDGEKMLVETIWKEDGSQYDYYDHCITDEELDNVILCLQSQIKRKFTIRVSGTFSRCFEIEASSYEEALSAAKEEWEINPLIQEDVDGEDWDGYALD